MRPPLPNGVEVRDEAFQLYWHFASERQRIFYRRLEDSRGPWTADPILTHFKFCNTFRVADRVTQDLLGAAIYSDDAQTLAPIDRIFRTIVYRFFSKPSTWQFLDSAFGILSVGSYNEEGFRRQLDGWLEDGHRLYTGAFILCATQAYGYQRKHYNHAALFADLARDDGAILRSLAEAPNLEAVYQKLRELPLIGKFMAYQIAIDLNYGPDLNFSESSFVAAGPGAERGLRKCFTSFGRETPESLIQWIAGHQEELAAHYGEEAPTLFGRPLQSIDCQGLFCETDKYCRVALPELRSARSRIKATFTPDPNRVTFMAPPKWNLEIPTSVLRTSGSPTSPTAPRQLSMV
jgi:hypothetical protein